MFQISREIDQVTSLTNENYPLLAFSSVVQSIYQSPRFCHHMDCRLFDKRILVQLIELIRNSVLAQSSNEIFKGENSWGNIKISQIEQFANKLYRVVELIRNCHSGNCRTCIRPERNGVEQKCIRSIGYPVTVNALRWEWHSKHIIQTLTSYSDMHPNSPPGSCRSFAH